MKKYIKPELNTYMFEVETSIMDATPSPTPAITQHPQSLTNSVPADVAVESRYYADYQSVDGTDWTVVE